MASCLTNEDKKCLIEDVKNILGGGIRKIEISNEAWCTLLKFAVENYVMHLQKWLITNQWGNFAGKDINKTDICFALTTRTLDFENQFTYAFSKQVGLQTTGPFELKKDFIVIEEGTQVYEIPRGREINEVLWVTPSDIDLAVLSSIGWGSLTYTDAFGYAALPGYGTAWGGYGAGYGAYYVAPAYDILLRAQDFSIKNKMLSSDLTYKVTAGPNGTRLLHLLSIPNNGTRYGIRKSLYGCKVWYYYYDTEVMKDDDKIQCIDECADIIKYPSELPLTKIDYCDLNELSKVFVRKYLVAGAKETLGKSRGKFMGKLIAPDATNIEMEYASLEAQGIQEIKEINEEVANWLLEMRSDKLLERKANEAKSTNEILQYQPMGLFVK